MGTDAAEQEDRHLPSSCSPLARAQSMADRSSSTNEESPMELGSQLGAPVVLGTWLPRLLLGPFICGGGSHNICVCVCWFLIWQVALKLTFYCTY